MNSIIVFLIALIVVIGLAMVYLISKKLMKPLPRAYTGPDKKQAVGPTPVPGSGGPSPLPTYSLTSKSSDIAVKQPVKSYVKKPPIVEKEDPVEIWRQDTREIFKNMVRAREEQGFEMEFEECMREISQYKDEWMDEEDHRDRPEVSDEINDYNERMCDKLFG